MRSSPFAFFRRLIALHLLAYFGLIVVGVVVAHAQPPSKPRVVLIAGEYEYGSMLAFPVLGELLQREFGFDWVCLPRSAGEHIPGLEALERADLVIAMIRRMTLPPEDLGRIKRYLESGRPFVGVRSTCHAFENWPGFVREVLGGNYRFPPYLDFSVVAMAHVNAAARNHPILAGVPETFATGSVLYRTLPLAPGAEPLLFGDGPKLDGAPEPMAWTYQYRGGRIFFSSLGHIRDFRNPAFLRLLLNGIHWTLGRPAPRTEIRPEVFSGLPVKSVGMEDFQNLISYTLSIFIVVDVRRPSEFAAGHLANAVNIDFEGSSFSAHVAALDRRKPIVVYGDSGRPSAPAAAQMKKLGFEVVYDAAVGFSEWKAAGKPVVR